MSEQHLPEVDLTPEQACRADYLSATFADTDGFHAARLIVHLQDRITQLESTIRGKTFVTPEAICSCGMPAEPPADVVRDAERYQWIKARASKEYAMDRWDGAMWNLYSVHDPKGGGLDAAIDAARGALETTEGAPK